MRPAHRPQSLISPSLFHTAPRAWRAFPTRSVTTTTTAPPLAAGWLVSEGAIDTQPVTGPLQVRPSPMWLAVQLWVPGVIACGPSSCHTPHPLPLLLHRSPLPSPTLPSHLAPTLQDTSPRSCGPLRPGWVAPRRTTARAAIKTYTFATMHRPATCCGVAAATGTASTGRTSSRWRAGVSRHVFTSSFRKACVKVWSVGGSLASAAGAS